MFFGFHFMRTLVSKAQPLNSMTTISKLLELKPLNQEIKVVGWLKSNRKYKGQNFLHIDDGSSLQRLQVIVPKAVLPKNLTYHACLAVEGEIQDSPGPMQSIELLAKKIMVVSPGAPIEFPFIERGTYLQEDIRLLPHFRSRTKEFASILRVRAQAKASIRKYFEEKNFINIDTPILTTNNCEGGGVTFSVKGHGEILPHKRNVDVADTAFGHPVYLTVSGQLHLEAMASGMAKVYNFSPAFRGEFGSRFHLHEFWMVEMEESFLEKREGFVKLLDRLEDLVKFSIERIIRVSEDDVKFLWKFFEKENLEEVVSNLLKRPFVRLKYKDAIHLLGEYSKLSEKSTLQNINREGELFLTKHFGDVPVFITEWPSSLKPFYSYTEEEDGEEIAFSVDLLMPNVGEVAGGGLREYRIDILEKKMQALDEEKLNWYLDLRQFGYAPSGGFGLGFERFLQFLLGIDNIKDTIPFPRANKQCFC